MRIDPAVTESTESTVTGSTLTAPAPETPVVLPDLGEAVRNHRDLELGETLPAWKRVWKSRRLMHHHRLVVIVLVANALFLAYWLTSPTLAGANNAVLVNFALAVLVRQQRVINLLFKIATSAPTSWPLKIRATLGKVYHFGGLHVGGTFATTAWFVVVAVGTAIQGGSFVLTTLGAAIATLLVGIFATALPAFRARFHDHFELIHRFAGWTALGLFGAFAMLNALTQSNASGWAALLGSPAVWVFLLVATSVASTWWDLRLVNVEYDNPSRHVVIAKFKHRNVFAGSSTALSRSPLTEWHHFANVNTPGEDGFRLTISRAGDWTGSLIDEQPAKLWVKGIPTAGVGNIDQLFKKVLWVATGSGIGPCLPHLLSGDTPAGLVWSTRDPIRTYGEDLVAEILDVQPEATLWDTTSLGKPDLVKLAFAAQQEVQAEAVICISNKPTTWSIVEAFEERGIPAYGAIWDS